MSYNDFIEADSVASSLDSLVNLFAIGDEQSDLIFQEYLAHRGFDVDKFAIACKMFENL
jgi:hypothetical protein